MDRRLNAAEGVLGSPARNLVVILLFMAVVMIAATVAYMAAGWSLADASYMVALTVYTVGYGEVRPINTAYLHAVTMCLMAFGCTGMILLTSALVQLFTELQLRQILGAGRMQHKIEHLADHVVICGYGRIGVMLAKELSDAKMPLVVLERSAEKLAQAEEDGHLCMSGDATLETTLLAAGIERARVLATVLPDDAANVFITLSARNLNPKLEIIARGEASTTENKLRHAGADRVVLPTRIGAARMARMILYPESSNLTAGARLQQVSHNLDDLGVGLELLTAVEGSSVCGLTVEEAERRGAGAFLIVQIDRGADQHMPRPEPSQTMAAGDRVLVLSKGSPVAARLLFSTREKIRVGRNTL